MSWGANVQRNPNESYEWILIQFKQFDWSTDRQIIPKRTLMHIHKCSPVHLSILKFNVICFLIWGGRELIVLLFTLNQRFQT